jgi:hypothetical protein
VARCNQAHVEIADPRAVLGLVEEAVTSVIQIFG